MPNSPTPFRLILTTAANPGAASRLARILVEERLAACATLMAAATSIYRWKGQVETADEVVVLLKTTEEQVAGLEKRLKELHNYETPEFLVLKVEGGSAEYLAWLQSSVGEPQGES